MRNVFIDRINASDLNDAVHIGHFDMRTLQAKVLLPPRREIQIDEVSLSDSLDA
jgi:hypothetical protein